MANAKACVILGPNQAIPFESPFVPYPMYGSRKYDGWRLLIKEGELLSRTGKPYRSIPLRKHLKDVMERSKKDKMVFDGEIYDHINFPQLSSMFASFNKPVLPTVRYMVFDALTLDQWVSERGPTYYYRHLFYSDYITKNNVENVVPVEQALVNDANEARELYQVFLKEGFEGIILRNRFGFYKHGRCTLRERNLFKFKEFVTADAIIVGFEQGRRMKEEVRTGERTRDVRGFLERTHKQDAYELEERIGSVQVKLEDGTEVGVGLVRGMKEVAERRGFTWANRDKFIDKWVEIRYMRVGAKDRPRMGGITKFRDDLDGMTLEQKKLGVCNG